MTTKSTSLTGSINLTELKTPPNPHIEVKHISAEDGSDKYDYITKVIILGDAGVGKSSILRMFTESVFELNPISTMGIDFSVAFMKITHTDDTSTLSSLEDEPLSKSTHFGIGKYLIVPKKTGLRKQIRKPIFKFQVWDCAGQERFHSIVKSYIRGANIVVYAFDITDQESFSKISKWRKSVEDEIGTPEEGKYMSVLVGNKLDAEKERHVSQKDAKKLASNLNTFYTEVSAKKNTNIQELFEEIARVMYCKMLNGSIILDHKSMMLNRNITIANTSTPNDSNNKCFPGGCIIL